MMLEDFEQIPPPRYRHERITGPQTEDEMLSNLLLVLAKAVPRELMQRLGKQGTITVSWDDAFRLYLRGQQCRKTFRMK